MKYFILGYNNAPIGESGESCKSIYDLQDACAVCGTGAKLVGKLRTKALTKVTKDFFATLDTDYIISERLYEKLVSEKIKIGELANIIDYKNNDLPFYHLYTNIFFPVAARKGGLVIEDQCPFCKRNGYFNKVIIGNPQKKIPTQTFPVDLCYSLPDIEVLNISDFFFTWECMGLSNLVAQGNKVIRYARPLLIVSDKFKDILEKFKVKGVEFEPVVIDICGA